ncbi:MAG: c-type cytochrome [Planctomycetes bacterium]|nr:c-type cytochrome [Planctomycetota bacterium]
MNRIFLLAVFAIPSLAHAQAFKMEPGPKSPAESLKCIKVRPGFKVELMVSEPLVQDPIAFAWGPDGKFWVVEMGDYPLGVPSPGKSAAIPGGKPGGRIKYLEKSKPGGPYDKMTLFMDNLGYPTGVFPYARGVLVTCAPDIFYAERGKDGKVKKEVLFTGFKEGNQQHRVNGLTWGIDNWIYGANGDSGGIVKSIKTGKSVNISGRDFRFKPETGEFETVTGQSQFGRCRDDWGNWFGCNNSNPLFHFVLEDRYLKRNPHVLYPNPKVQVIPGAIRVYPISKPLPRFNTPQGLNHFTSACSAIIYRDNFFGKEFEGNVFISEPVHNLIHRQILKPKGVTFTAQRAKDEQKSEFLASTDNWFRPTMIQVGPDGALWIADMYRYVIEHPEWIPKDWQKKLDLRAGHDKGRIYRVVPVGKTPREIVRMDGMKSKEVAKQLESPAGWVRDTAHQFLYERYFEKDIAEAKTELKSIALNSKFAQARLHAFNVSEYLDLPRFSLLEAMLNDKHAGVRRHAIRFAWWYPLKRSTLQLQRVLNDPDAQIRLQAVYTLGGWPQTGALLAEILCDQNQERHIYAAAMSSVSAANYREVLAEVTRRKNVPEKITTQLVRLAKAFPAEERPVLPKQLVRFPALALQGVVAVDIPAVGVWLKSMDATGATPGYLINDPEQKVMVARLYGAYRDAQKIAANNQANVMDRIAAIRILNRGIADNKADRKILGGLLTIHTTDQLQAAAVQQIGLTDHPAVVNILLKHWKSYTPGRRAQVLDLILSKVFWTRMAVIDLRNKRIDPGEIGAIHRQRFLLHTDAGIRNDAKQIFADASNTKRATLADLYWLQLPDKGDATRGAKLFAKSCAVCHKVGNVGNNVGPDLASVKDKSPQGMLIAILDPNRAVETRYINYQATTKKGLTYTGILSAETSTTITLTGADGKEHQLLRNELDELSSTGKSQMPEGLEKDLRPQDIADIIAHVRSIHAR